MLRAAVMAVLLRCREEAVLSQEALPLHLLAGYCGEPGRERKRKGRRDRRAPALEGRAYGAGKEVCVERRVLRKRMDVEEVAHAAVGFAENDHRVQLLRDGRLGTVGPKPGPRKIEQAGILQPLRLGHDGIADADIDLHAQARLAQARLKDGAQPAIGILRPNRSDADRRGQILEAVELDSGVARIGEYLHERLLGHFAQAEQIRIPGGTDRFAEPDEHEQRALQDEPVRMP